MSKENNVFTFSPSANDVDILIFKAGSNLPILSTLEDGLSQEFRDYNKAESNVEFICMAANSHYDILNALRIIVDKLQREGVFANSYEYAQAKSAINKYRI